MLLLRGTNKPPDTDKKNKIKRTLGPSRIRGAGAQAPYTPPRTLHVPGPRCVCILQIINAVYQTSSTWNYSFWKPNSSGLLDWIGLIKCFSTTSMFHDTMTSLFVTWQQSIGDHYTAISTVENWSPLRFLLLPLQQNLCTKEKQWQL